MTSNDELLYQHGNRMTGIITKKSKRYCELCHYWFALHSFMAAKQPPDYAYSQDSFPDYDYVWPTTTNMKTWVLKSFYYFNHDSLWI